MTVGTALARDRRPPLRAPSAPPGSLTEPTILLLGPEPRLARNLEARLGARVRTAESSDETDGVGIDVVVVAGPYPLSTLTDVRVHPRLSHLPVVLVAPGRRIDRRGWDAVNVRPVVEIDRPVERTIMAIRDLLGVSPTDGGPRPRSLQVIPGREGRREPGSATRREGDEG